MRRFFILLNREISHYFHTPMAYIVLFFFLLLTGFDFQYSVASVALQGGYVSVAFFNSVFFWFPFVLAFPLLTMRLFSEEYNLGTIESLMTAPVSDSSVVLAKFFGALFFYIVLWAPSMLYFVLFRVITGQNAAETYSFYFGSYLLVLLVGMFYIALGCLASSLTKNQIVSAFVAFALVSFMFFLSLLSMLFPTASTALGEFIYYFSTIEHMVDFSQGVFDSRPIVFYLTMTVFTLFVTFHVFQHRRWKS